MRSFWPLLAFLSFPVFPLQSPPDRPMKSAVQTKEVLHFGVEWRLIRAGTIKLTWSPIEGPRNTRWQADLHAESAGLVSKLYKVDDNYSSLLQSELCAADVLFRTNEGRRQRETKVSFHDGKANYLERDLVKNSVVLAKEIEVPKCVHDLMGGLFTLRTLKLEPGQSTQIPMSDGKKSALVRVEAMDREEIRTPAGTFKTIRYEASLFNEVIYSKKGRLFIWITDDAKRVPVQVQAAMKFLIGNITAQLEKHER